MILQQLSEAVGVSGKEDAVRKVVLNAILWTAKMEVPAGGVATRVSAEDLKENLDRKR